MKSMTNLILVVGLTGALAIRGVCQVPEYPIATVAVGIRDESNISLSGVRLTGVFARPETFHRTATKIDKKTTNAAGEAVVGGRTDGICSVQATKEGYYFSARGLDFSSSEGGRWLPSPRQETLILKKVVKPVPMYAAARWPVTLPARAGSFGFDLEKRDWVAPHGAGVKADLIFTQEVKDDGSFGLAATLRVSFSKPADGLIPLYELPGAESELKLPRTAPAEGYETERKFTMSWSPSREPTPLARPALGYIYRVRTVLDEKGQVKSAWHGKIDGEFEWDARNFPTGQVTFTYYLNPDATPNLEFDRKKNLFLDLADEHTVRRP